MIKANKPEINVDELKNKIREEVARRQSSALAARLIFSITTMKNAVDFGKIEALINNAEFRDQVRTKWPDKLNRFPFNISRKFQNLALKGLEIIFRDQHEVNFNILQALKEFLLLNRQLIEHTETLQAQVSVIDNRLNAIEERVGAMDNRVNAIDAHVGAMDNRLEANEEHVGAMDNRLEANEEHVGAMDNRLKANEEHVGAMDNRLNALKEHVGAMDNRLNAIEERVTATGNHLNAIDERVTATGNHLNAIDERVTATGNHLNAIDERVTATGNHLNAIDERVTAMDERHIRDDSYLKNDLAQQKRLITLFLEEARQRFPEPFNQKQIQTLGNEEQHLLDAFYVAFEDQFRGSREEITDRLKVYLPLIEEAKVGTQSSPILDVGCGRGEWLELLRKSGYTARGLDINRVMIDQCRARGLKVVEEDVISYLQFIPDASLGALTGFHIIEHLPFEVLIKLFDETVRVLKPGGVVIFETPNPQNLLVSSNFYVDPTHLNPLPSPLIKFVAEARGLYQVKILELHPYPSCFRVSGSELAERFNDYFYGPQDYAVIGYKI